MSQKGFQFEVFCRKALKIQTYQE